jgi:PIN domain nuclease of toxin-antitoxin system
LIYLDTHVVVWLYAGLTENLSDVAKSLINEHELYISPIVRLELQYLYEIGRIRVSSDVIVNDLSNSIGLNVCQQDFNLIIDRALNISWTRDPFDRLIVSNATINENILLTKDSNILNNYQHSVWN